MTIVQRIGTGWIEDAESDYPTLLRIGHQYETTLGQRLAVGGFRGPQDIAINSDNSLYVLNRGSSNLDEVPPTRYVRVNIDDDGYENDIVMNTDGAAEASDVKKYPSPVMCVLDSQNVLFHTDERSNIVAAIKTTGEAVGEWGESGDGVGYLNGPSGITLDAAENLWIVNSRDHRIQHFTREGEFLGGFGEYGSEPGQLDHPWGVSVDPINGSLVIADWRNSRIQRFSTDGELMQVIGQPGSGVGELDHPSGVAVDKYGDIYVADRNNHRVLMFNWRGLFVESFRGDATINPRGISRLMGNPDILRQRDNVIDLDREKRLKYPTSVKVDDDHLYIVDTGRYRVQIYRKLCRLLEPGDVEAASVHKDPSLN
jgi:hypothetical protein